EEDIIGIGSGLDHVEVTESLTPQVFAALETHVNNWLTLRFGANKGAFSHVKAEDKTTGETINLSYSNFSMNIGTGVKVGQLQLGGVRANTCRQTRGWIGGGQAGQSFPKVTATYPF